MDIYREAILDHYKHPRNFGHLDKPDVKTAEHNVSCGDRIVMEVKYSRDRNGTIETIRFSGEGCAVSIAAASMLTEKVVGMRISDALTLGTNEILELLGSPLTPTRVKCAILPLEVLHKAIAGIGRIGKELV